MLVRRGWGSDPAMLEADIGTRYWASAPFPADVGAEVGPKMASAEKRPFPSVEQQNREE